MRKIKGTVVIILLAMLFVGICFADKIVIRKGQIESIEGNVVTIVTNCGTAWEWGLEERECFKEGDKVKLVMYNKDTEKVLEDDVILKIVVDK